MAHDRWTQTSVCEGLEATASLARRLAAALRPGDWVTLDGPLGAGKTTLVRYLAAALGHEPSSVSSPTFVLMQRYESGDSSIPIVHVDAYRSNGPDELEAAGWDTIGGDCVVLVEWSERIEDALPESFGVVALTHAGERTREVRLDLPASWLEREGARALEREDTTCPVTGDPVPADSATWPFASERARLVDLHKWFSEDYLVSRPIEERDLDLQE